MKIAFVWQGVSDPKIFNHWNDGLRAAMRILEKKYEVKYYEPWDEITEDVILYWEAPCTINGENAAFYNRVRSLSGWKALLFAGGPIKAEWLEGFNHIYVESKVNCEELCALNIPHSTAFGINEQIFKPLNIPKVFKGIHHGTCASWKRQWLLGEAFGEDAVLCGREQENDTRPWDEARKHGTLILPDLPPQLAATMVNSSHALIQTADVWGGGQRATLEAMACNVPVICMSDSPKNMEYVEESGFGEIAQPSKEQILAAFERLQARTFSNEGREYIESKWTAQHYADALEKEFETICN